MFKKITSPTILLLVITLNLSSCNSDSRLSTLKKCQTLADESIVYARANYVKLFHHFNPEKFEATFQKVADFDNIKHRNVISTYEIAVRKLKVKDPTTKAFLLSCQNLAHFSTNLVDQTYPRAIAHKSKHPVLTNEFFIEINQIVQFDHNIGQYNNYLTSFKQQVSSYQQALKKYSEQYKEQISAER